MTWNYRVIRKWYDGGGEDTGYGYYIHQCHYERGAERDTIPHSWSHGPVPAFGEEAEDLFQDLKMMARAFAYPILEEHNGKLREVK